MFTKDNARQQDRVKYSGGSIAQIKVSPSALSWGVHFFQPRSLGASWPSLSLSLSH